ncbi:MAG: LarC family nickel insertion protein [Planctomycetota bacterium]|jgi:uncharacterized protein (TIGR00299 family) protein|nr:LarC family nickel insertion protein [Planctomycetota bacterium]
MHLHIDCSLGMSGDMFLAALVDAGADLDAVKSALEALPLEGFSLHAEKAPRGGISTATLDVRDHTDDEPRGCGHGGTAGDDDHGRRHRHQDHAHSHGHERPHDGHAHRHGDHGHSHEGTGPHRHLTGMLALLNPDVLSPLARERAERIFRILAEAEAAVHSVPLDKVHFHEISGVDTAVDVIGACVALDLLGAASVSASAPSTGSGMIACAHGLLPVPAPATLEILKSRGIPWRSGGDGERLTPTGAALLAGLAESFDGSPELNVLRIGYGGGKADFADAPNLVRVIVGAPTAGRMKDGAASAAAEFRWEAAKMPLAVKAARLPAECKPLLPDLPETHPERVVEFRAVVDDMTPETVAFLQEACLRAGAVEAYSLPATMKKGRLGHEITVIAHSAQAGEVLEAIWRHSSTFGVRLRETSRLTLAREMRVVEVDGNPIRIKVGVLGDEAIRRQPEYEDCRAAALATGKSIREIFRLAEQAANGG